MCRVQWQQPAGTAQVPTTLPLPSIYALSPFALDIDQPRWVTSYVFPQIMCAAICEELTLFCQQHNPWIWFLSLTNPPSAPLAPNLHGEGSRVSTTGKTGRDRGKQGGRGAVINLGEEERAANTAIHPIKEKRAREATFDPLRQHIKVIIAHDKQTTN